MSFKLTILGCSSAIPTIDRNPTAQLLNVNERFFLIDCGEGTQVQLRKFQLSFQRINHIFISHLHGDHYFGLIGLISSMHLLGRKKDLHIHAHSELKEIIDLQFRHSFENLSKYKNKTTEVLIEKESKKSNTFWSGRNEQNIMVVFPKKNLIPGELVEIFIESNTATTLIGRAI